MKAWVLREQKPITEKPLSLEEVPKPEPGSGQIRVRVTASGICRTDIHVAEGDLPLHKSPLILGHEVVGNIDALGDGVIHWKKGQRVGLTWLGKTCESCDFCRSNRENYCKDFMSTGWHLDGGFAEYMLADQSALLDLEGVPLDDEHTVPLLCPGVAGFAALKLAEPKPGQRLGLYGFGPTAYYVLKAAIHLGMEVYVSSRSEKNLNRARENGAVWAADTAKEPLPKSLHAAVVFPPVGGLVERALEPLSFGGVLVLAPVAMTPIHINDYSQNLWGRDIRTLYNVNMTDSRELLQIAAKEKMTMGVSVVEFDECQEAMIRVKKGHVSQPNVVVRL